MSAWLRPEVRCPRAGMLAWSGWVGLWLLLSVLVYALFFHGNPSLFGPDGFFHYRVAELMASQQRWWVDIDSLPYTVLGPAGPDHQWLFHLLLVPFTLCGDGAGHVVAAAAMAALPAVAVYAVLRQEQVPLPWLFTALAFLSSSLLITRYLQLRTQGLALVLIVCLMVTLVRRQYLASALLAYVFLASYHGATIMLPMLVMALVVIYLRDSRLDMRLVLALSMGSLLALLVSPWFPANLEYLFFHVLSKVRTPLQGMLGVEWRPMTMHELWGFGQVLLVAVVLLVPAVVWQWVRRGDRPTGMTVAFAGLSLLAMVMMLSSVRFIEYWIPLTAMALGFCVRDFHLLPQRPGVLVTVGLLALMTWIATGQVNTVRALPADGQVRNLPTEFARISSYVNAHGAAGDLILNSRWSDYQMLFYHMPDKAFVNGLDGHYLAYGDPARFNTWYRVITNSVPAGEDMANFISESMPVRWIVVSRMDAGLLASIDSSPRILLREATVDGWLFEVLPAR